MKNGKNGITLIALIITIILMLILASVAINVVIDGGLFNQAGKAVNNTEIASEKETVQKATVLAESTSKTGRITVEEMQKAINSITQEGSANAIDNGDTIVVKFNKSDRYYEIDNKGNVEGPKELVKDEHPGDLTKGGTCDGSEENPYQITCIEDLVVFSIMVNGGNTELGISSNRFSYKYVELTRTLDFKSMFSYDDYTTTKYGDLNTDGEVEDIRTELTKTDEGCIGFTPIGGNARRFEGTFDGNGNEINNIYQKNTIDETSIALFGYASKEIKNLSISGTIINDKWHAAGICAYGEAIINNCNNYANITGYNMVGGIMSWSIGGNIISCKNYGTITITGRIYGYGNMGGIVGVSNPTTIESCANYGNVISKTDSLLEEGGGIVGTSMNGVIKDCINMGKCNGGIIGSVSSSRNHNSNKLL